MCSLSILPPTPQLLVGEFGWCCLLMIPMNSQVFRVTSLSYYIKKIRSLCPENGPDTARRLKCVVDTQRPEGNFENASISRFCLGFRVSFLFLTVVSVLLFYITSKWLPETIQICLKGHHDPFFQRFMPFLAAFSMNYFIFDFTYSQFTIYDSAFSLISENRCIGWLLSQSASSILS
ncbi:hypothetical protein Y032_0067g50 [Ancylostoma ceylanicum]|uniref:Uncharacterized protein n=1 Tax=Ancylostoma ceylanicum TaxID=53326 RepID=A0A016TZF8_9BILA|nr:hypothetical protein Y032_0067g50 [Ancylostoma ceylanicum]